MANQQFVYKKDADVKDPKNKINKKRKKWPLITALIALVVLLGAGGFAAKVIGIGSKATVYTSTTNPNVWAYKFYAVKTSTADTGLYPDAVGIGLWNAKNTKAIQHNKSIVYADEDKTVDGTNYTHIHFTAGDPGYWINSKNLSWEKTEVNGDGSANHPLSNTCYNKEGEIRYTVVGGAGANFSTEFKAAIAEWSGVLGNVILPADAQHPATLTVRYSGNDTSGKRIPDTTPAYDVAVTSVGTWPDSQKTHYIAKNTVTLTINTNLITKKTDPGIVKSLFVHELGHALGLGHTGDGGGNNNNVAAWSWATPQDNDVMWTGGPANAQEVLTPQDKAAAQLARALKMFATQD